ncbi:hypothetical protein [Acaryochloris sp. CCMEE 5410]|uniref:hypothetical protein n=1 Tax=Acaryochloris sp. CCMEE 5410 TaxID=310037 RepID=UPI00024846A2|nr:hypothetical protein [Acaryochloris sp. CCMEE 5410]KAI9134303.1 hypothetical protein ON05_014100 [Acaryochloris sp. CCMEE 5410]
MFVMIGLSIAIGISCGVGVIGLIWLHRGNQGVNSFLPAEHLIGSYGVVDIPFADRHPGKVRVNIGDSVLNLRAFAYTSEQFELGDGAFVVAVEDNCVFVVSRDSLQSLAPIDCNGDDIDPLLRDLI